MPANPSNSQFRVGFEATEGFGDPASWQDFRILSETLGSDLPTIQDESILALAEQEEGLPTKITPGGDINVNWMPEDHAKFFAGFMGKGATPVQSPTGVYTHKLAISETDVTFGKMAVEATRDLDNAVSVKRPEVYVGCLPSQITFNAGPRSLLSGAVSLVSPRWHFFEDASEVTSTGGTAPFIRGFGSYANLQSAGDLGDVYVEVQGSPGATMDIKCKLGNTATYDGTAITITPGVWTTLTDENDAPIGTDDLPVQIYWPDFTSIAASDEWFFDRERPVWSQSLPTSSALNEIFITILLDGTAFRTREISLTAARPASPDEAIGGRFLENDQVSEFGRRTTSGSLNRRALDTTLVDRLLRAEPFSLRVDALGPEIGATGVRRSLSLVMMNCIASGRTPSIGGAASFDEPIDFTAHPSADVTYPDALTFEVVNSQASLA